MSHLSSYTLRAGASCSPASLPRPPAATALLLRRASAGALACCAAAVSSPGSATAAPWPPAVQRVLEHLQANPMAVSSSFMQYDAEPTVPLPECVRGLAAADVLPPGVEPSTSAAVQHYAAVIAGLCYAAVGGLDKAHNLVTPLCWGSWTPYAGKPVPHSPAAPEAAYVHAIVHRQEGLCDGEFGSGFSNAMYWYRAAAAERAAFAPALLDEARRLAKGSPTLEQHVAGHGESWNPGRFVDLCTRVARGGGAGASAAGEQLDKEAAFCQRVMAAELRLLLEHCYARLHQQQPPEQQ